MAGTPDDDDTIWVDRISHGLFPEAEGTPEENRVRGIVAAELARWKQARIRDYVPIFVERHLRRAHHLAHPQPR
jgi:hypothetical protein